MLTLSSPAKINLFLQILGKRPDGYHELASLFQAVSLRDMLTFRLADRDQLRCNLPDVPLGQNNLIWRAVEAFRAFTGLTFSIDITLDKHIPMQAGLGGGSSNAATTLWAVNHLLGSPLSEQALAGIGAQLGSDVPFFFSSGSAFCTGRGENVASLAPLASRIVFIAKPESGLSTPQVYQHFNMRDVASGSHAARLAAIIAGEDAFCNDLEPAALRLSPELATFKQNLLNTGFNAVMLSGSGSAFFCLGEARELPTAGVAASFVSRDAGSWYLI